MTDPAVFSPSPAGALPEEPNVPATWLMAAGDSLTDALGILVPVRDSDGHIWDFTVRYANPAAGMFAGKPAAELIGRRLLELTPKLRHIGLFDVLVWGCEHRTQVERELPLARTGQDERRVSVRAHPMDGAMVVILQDKTEQARRSRQRDALLEHHRLVGSVTEDVVWEWDIPGDRLSIGNTLMGLPPGSPVSATTWWSEGLHPEDRQAFDAMLHQLTTGAADSWAGTYRYRHADGRYRLVLDRRQVLRDVDRRPVRMIGTLSDLSGISSLVP
jgi:PAS domain-containing protein